MGAFSNVLFNLHNEAMRHVSILILQVRSEPSKGKLLLPQLLMACFDPSLCFHTLSYLIFGPTKPGGITYVHLFIDKVK